MEPNLSSPGQSPERHFPVPEVSQPVGPEVAPSAPEKAAGSPESNNGAGRGDTPPPAVAPARPLPPIQPPASPASPTTDVADDNPAVAGDDDLIEKEWVDKAKQIISETKDDPYAQEKAVSKLQADYLKKRYGRAVGLSDK